MHKAKLVVLFFYFFINCLNAQKIDRSEFFRKFNKASDFNKVLVFDSLPENYKFIFYPELTDKFNSIKEKAKSEKNSTILYKIDYNEALYNNSIYKYEAAIKTLNNILKLPEGLNFEDSVQVFYLLKKSYLKTKNVLQALESQKQLEELKKRNKNLPFWLLNPTLSQMYLEIGLYDQAIQQLKIEYATYPLEFSDDDGWASYYNNMGVFFNKANRPDSAIVNFILSKKRYESILNKNPNDVKARFFDGLIDGNIGQALKSKKEYAAAIPLLKKDIFWSFQIDENRNAAISLNELGECYFMLNDFKLSEEKLDSAYNILKNTDNVAQLLQNLKLKAKLYEYSKEYKKSVEFYGEFIKLSDSVNLEKNTIQAIFQQESYKTIEREKLVTEQKIKIIEEEQKIKQQSDLKNIFMTCFFAATLVLLYFLLKNRTSKKQKNLLELKNNEIENHKLQLEKSLKDKETLFKEVQHRVRNNMQVISSLLALRINKTEDSNAKELLKDGRRRVDSISLIHKLLYENNEINKIKIDEYLNTLIGEISSNLESDFHSKITFVKNIEKITFDIDTCIPLGLITTEIIANAYKYAFPNKEGVFTINLSRIDSNRYELLLSDNGVGLPWDFESKKASSLGIELIEMLADQIDATIVLEGTSGVSYKLNFKYPNNTK
jgi:two-component sensor histidine kinase